MEKTRRRLSYFGYRMLDLGRRTWETSGIRQNADARRQVAGGIRKYP
jgi:hypothetical protein